MAYPMRNRERPARSGSSYGATGSPAPAMPTVGYNVANGSSPYPGRGPAPQQYSTPGRPGAPYMGAASSSGYRPSPGAMPQRPMPQRPPQQAQQPIRPPAPAPPQVYRYPLTHPAGPLAFFQPPPGQTTTDPTLTRPPASQALLSTYPSRVRTGVTGLIQPEHITGGPREREAFLAEMERELAASGSGGPGGPTTGPGGGRGPASGASTPRFDSPAPAAFSSRRGAAPQTTMSGRRGRVVNYAENEESDEEESESEMSELEEPPSDPEDESYGERRRRDKDGNPLPSTLPSSRRREPDRHGSSSGYGVGGATDVQSAMRAGKWRKRREELERGWTWLGDRTPGERVTSVRKAETKHQYVSEDLLEREAQKPEALVPISIDLEIQAPNGDGPAFRLKDRFIWNMNEAFITPFQFASILCEDLGISMSAHAQTIAELIQNQIEEASTVVEVDLVDDEVGEDDVVWSEDEDEAGAAEGTGGDDATRQRGTSLVLGKRGRDARSVSARPGKRPSSVRAVSVQVGTPLTPLAETPGGPETPAAEGAGQEEGDDAAAAAEDDDDEEVAEVPEKKHKVWTEADCRIIVNLDVQIATHILRDRIEWDLSSPLPPVYFAKAYCADLGLTGEALPLITHAITEELLKHKKDALDLQLFQASHPYEQGKWEKSTVGGGLRVNRREGAKPLVGVWREWAEREEFAPVMVELSMEEMERREVERTREARRMMRGLNTSKRRR